MSKLPRGAVLVQPEGKFVDRTKSRLPLAADTHSRWGRAPWPDDGLGMDLNRTPT